MAMSASVEREPDHAIPAMVKSRQPPPESDSSIRLRRQIIASFWAIIILLGLPMWWRTTAIYRAELPLQVMNEWADGKASRLHSGKDGRLTMISQACRPVFPPQIFFEAGHLQPHEAQSLLRMTQHALDDLNDFSAHHLRLQLSSNTSQAQSEDGNAALTVRLVPGAQMDAKLNPYEPRLDLEYMPSQIPSGSSSSSTLATFMATMLRELFAEEQAMIAYLLSTSSAPPERSAKDLAPEMMPALAKWNSRTVKYARTYHLTFSMFTPTGTPSSWPIEEALEEHLLPLLQSFAAISNFTIDTQIQLYATPGISGDVLKKEDLSNFINAAEWPLSPSIGGAPTINFILYAGDLKVEGSGNSWLIPQWGGVVIQPDVSDLRPAMLTFSKQLISLMGAPQGGSLPLRLMTLMRVRTAGLLLKAGGTMGSLARLVQALPSISIPREVADGVQTTTTHLRAACDGLGGPQGLEHARIAEEAAERAFFEKSMVGQVYFPDEHKVAVYLPLLGPIGVPLVMSVLKEIKAWKQRRSATPK